MSASPPHPTPGDAVREDRRQRLHPGFPVPLLRRAGLRGRPGQRDSAPQVRGLVWTGERPDLTEPHGPGVRGPEDEGRTGNISQAQERALTFRCYLFGFLLSFIVFFFFFSFFLNKSRIQENGIWNRRVRGSWWCLGSKAAVGMDVLLGLFLSATGRGGPSKGRSAGLLPGCFSETRRSSCCFPPLQRPAFIIPPTSPLA